MCVQAACPLGGGFKKVCHRGVTFFWTSLHFFRCILLSQSLLLQQVQKFVGGEVETPAGFALQYFVDVCKERTSLPAAFGETYRKERGLEKWGKKALKEQAFRILNMEDCTSLLLDISEALWVTSSSPSGCTMAHTAVFHCHVINCHLWTLKYHHLSPDLTVGVTPAHCHGSSFKRLAFLCKKFPHHLLQHVSGLLPRPLMNQSCSPPC